VTRKGRSRVEHPVEEMYALYQTGASLRQVGERFGLHRLRVGELFKEAGLAARPRGAHLRRDAYPVQEMHEMYGRGATLEEVSYKYSITPHRLSALFREHGLAVRPRGTPSTEYPVKEMYEVYAQGASLREVGERFGVSSQLVGQLFRKEGLAIRQRGVLTTEHPVEEMYALYESGATFREVGERYGLSAFNISEMFSRAGLAKRSDSKPELSAAEIEARKRGASPRVLEMYELYEHGATLEEIGDDFGITRERVRQLFKQAGLQTRTISATAALKQAADHQRADEIVDCFRQVKDLAVVAQELDIPKNVVTKVLRERLSPREYRELTASASAGPAKRFTDAELIEFLIEASSELGGTLTGTAFNVLARSRYTADGRLWPSKQMYALRFGSWRGALIGAQLDANPSSPVAGKGRFGTEQCVEALREVHLSLGKVPTRVEYERHWHGAEGRLPSSSTVIKRCGTWSEALRLAELSE
jgi:DNA-binding transcriptional regulator LsrR (DeoR family)